MIPHLIPQEEAFYKIRNHFSKLERNFIPLLGIYNAILFPSYDGYIRDQEILIHSYIRNLNDFTLYEEHRWWLTTNWWNVMEMLIISMLIGGMVFIGCAAVGGVVWTYMTIMVVSPPIVTTFMVLFLMVLFTWIGYLFI